MTYLYATPFFPAPGDWRGAYCLDFVKALKRQRPGMRVEVFVCGKGDDYEVEGVKVWRFEEKRLPGFVLPFLFRRRNERSFIAAVKRAGVDVGDLVICHGNTARFAIYPLAVKKLNPNCKTLLHHHDLASFGLNLGIFHKCALYNAWLFGKLRALHEQIDCYVFISEASRRSFLAAPNADWTVYEDYKAQMRGPKMFGCRSVKIKDGVVLHNGVDARLFSRVDHVERVEGGREDFVIGCSGNFEVLKDQMTLLRAVVILSRGERVERVEGGESWREELERGRIKVVFVGSGQERAKCEAYARENGLNVEFRDEVRHEELPRFYHELDLFVLPSCFEGFGCVYTEAWACGVSFIACEGQGSEDMIAPEDRGKWLCKPRDAGELAQKIAAYIENRWEQKLTGPVDIDTLVERFCERVAV